MAHVVSQDPGAREHDLGFGVKGDIKDGYTTRPSRSDDGGADNMLEQLGYKPELERTRSTLQVAFMSFVLASIPYGLATTMLYPLAGGGPVNIIWGWLGVSLIIICVAASLGEITSVYPTAGDSSFPSRPSYGARPGPDILARSGVPLPDSTLTAQIGVYYQAFMLASPQYRRVASWICGWLYVVGNITITLAVNFGTALFFVACINVFETEPGVGVLAGEPYQVFLIFLGLTFLCNAVSSLGNKWLPMLDTAAIFWTFAGVLAIVIAVLVVAKNGRHDAAYVFTHFEANSGWTDGWSFMVGLLHAGYATSSTGMVISMCEEVKKPATQVPKALVLTVCLNTLAGLLFLIPLVFVLPDITYLINLANGQPVPAIIKDAMGTSGGAFGLLVPLMVLAILCGIGCTTAASRCTWAFARDGAIPGSRWWKEVNQKLDVPLNAMMLSMAVQIILGVIYFGSSAAFNAFSGVGVISLTASYAIPIAISLFGGRSHLVGSPFNLGKFGVFANVVALAWSALAMPLFCMPTFVPATPATINYAPAVFVAACLISGGWYFAWGRKNYAGPPTQEDPAF
ncbi:LOW QUALITY PROTEIN: amino acid permease [Colletotrichum tofieldiae]|nr:LOW QUALITY PROTEIN: amino acid permease [Colletotrichum tofieldiae]GKT79122.1 LOW QUALITY PROTEIN: amino acid permease [Colletotrichum tofieldiae]